MAELCASISNTANRPRVMSIGVIHQRLLLQKKENSSPAIPKRCPVVFKKPIATFPSSAFPYTVGIVAIHCPNVAKSVDLTLCLKISLKIERGP